MGETGVSKNETRAGDAPAAHPWVAQAVQHGSLLAISGQVPLDSDGRLLATGVVGVDVDELLARHCARQCALNLLARAEDALGGTLDDVEQVVRLTVYVVATQGAASLPEVAHGASEAIVEALGGRGRHARAAVGVAALPLAAPVEVDALLSVRRRHDGPMTIRGLGRQRLRVAAEWWRRQPSGDPTLRPHG